MQHDALFFVGIFIFIFLVWLATGGPTHPISFAGPYLSSPTTAGDITTYFLPRASFGLGDSNANLPQISSGSTGGGPIEQNLESINDQTNQLAEQVRAAANFGTPSPYRGLVTISHNTGGPSNQDPTEQYIEIDASRNATASIDISGWQLVSTVTNYFGIIPEAAEVPSSGSVNPTAPIMLAPGEQAIISTGLSPIGVSFEENECTGYLGQYQTYSPRLDQECPAPLDEFNRYESTPLKDDNCYNLLERTQRCTTPSDATPGLSNACFNIIDNHLTYNGCATAHREDPGFLSGTWRVYLGQTSSLWKPSRDAVRLIDNQGRTVDLFTY